MGLFPSFVPPVRPVVEDWRCTSTRLAINIAEGIHSSTENRQQYSQTFQPTNLVSNPIQSKPTLHPYETIP